MITVPSAHADSLIEFYKAREELHEAHLSGDRESVTQKTQAYLRAEQKRRVTPVQR